MLTGDTCDPLFQVRLIIGDTRGELVSDEIISYALEKNNNSVRDSAVEVLTWLVSDIAYEMSHSVGDVYIDNKKLYDQLSDLLDRVKNDPSYITATRGIIIGGVSKTEISRVRDDTDVRATPITIGFYTD